MTNLANALRATAVDSEFMVERDVLNKVATRLERSEELRLHYDMLLSYLRAYDFINRDPGGYLRQMLIDGEKKVRYE